MISSTLRGLTENQKRRFNVQLLAIWRQERLLLNNPLCVFREYSFSLSSPTPPHTCLKTLVRTYSDIACSVPNLDEEFVAKSGGLISPTDRFLSVYDVNPDPLAEVEWPSGSGHYFAIERKEWNAESGRCEMLIRNDSQLHGVVFNHASAEVFDGAAWTVTKTKSYLALGVNRSDMDVKALSLFAGTAAVGDVTFMALASAFSVFVPALQDEIEDEGKVYRVIGIQRDAESGFYRLLARRYTE